jgi:hypothetical protein
LPHTVGVGHVDLALKASISVPPSLALVGVTLPPFVPNVLVGVGHLANAFAISRLNWPLICPCVLGPVPPTSGVGKRGDKPEPVPLMRRSNVGSSQHSPPAVIPERGQITEDSSESPSKERWAVFHEDEAGSNLANDARHVGPHA